MLAFGFFVLKLHDEFPLGTESILGHACILYGPYSKTQDIVAKKLMAE